jgi:hypothetical protein
MTSGDTNISILHFPAYTVGWVKIPKTCPDPLNHWEMVGEATGEITITNSLPVRLVVQPSVASDLSWLTLIEPTQLTELYLVQTDISDEGLQYSSHLSDIQVLMLSHTYENISDSGIIHIKPLINLRKLYLNATNIGDSALSYLVDWNKLEVLSIGATRVTDAGLKHLYSLSSLKKISFDLSYSGARKNHITENGLALLREALPHCLITTKD